MLLGVFITGIADAGGCVPRSYQTFVSLYMLLFGKSMTEPPNPPETLPQYIIDGVPKQDTESLHNLQAWIDEILEYRHEISPDEIEADPNESIEAVEDSNKGTVVIKKVTCGKDNWYVFTLRILRSERRDLVKPSHYRGQLA